MCYYLNVQFQGQRVKCSEYKTVFYSTYPHPTLPRASKASQLFPTAVTEFPFCDAVVDVDPV